jgi:chemotaxis protein CheX
MPERGRVNGGNRSTGDPLNETETGMDVRYINPFISSINNVFQTMLSTKVRVGKPTMANGELTSAQVSGIIGLSGDVQGSVVVSYPAGSACKIASKFAGVEMGLDSPDFADAIGELVNMVAGNAKKDFPEGNTSISLPSVIIGEGHKVSQLAATPFLIIPCETDLGAFSVEVALVVCNKPAAAVAGGAG